MKEFDNCGAMIKKIHDSLDKRANNSLRPYGITMTQMQLLLTINESNGGQLSLKELEQMIGSAQSTIAGIVSRLEQKGMVEAISDSDDKRVKIVSITDVGRERCSEAYRHIDETERYILSELTEAERSIFLTLLHKVYDTLH